MRLDPGYWISFRSPRVHSVWLGKQDTKTYTFKVGPQDYQSGLDLFPLLIYQDSLNVEKTMRLQS